MTDKEKAELYENFHQKVQNYILGKINNLQQAEDICSDVFLKVYEKLDTYDSSKASLSTWIFTITRNTLTDYYRTNRISEEIPETLAENYSIEDEVCSEESLGLLAKALEKLEKREKQIIVFHYYNGLTLKDIAEKIGISYSYAKLLHNKALAAMRAYL